MLTFIQKLSNWLEGYLKYIVAAILLTVPLFPKFPFLRIPGSQVAVRLEDFLIFGAVVVWAIVIFPKLKSFFKDHINRSIILFLAIGLLAVISGIFITNTVVPHIGVLHWARRVEYIIVFFIAVTSLKSREDLAFYIKILMIVVAVVFLFGIGQQHFNWPVITTQNSEYAKGVALRCPCQHIVSTFAGHYDMATFMILVIPLFFALVTSKKEVLKPFNVNNKLLKIALIIAILFGYWLIVNSASRISIVSYLGSITLALMMTRAFLWIPVVLILSLLFTATSSTLLERYTRAIQLGLERLMSMSAGAVHAQGTSPVPTPEPPPAPFATDRSTSIRLNVEWPRAIRAFRKNPLFGTGYSSISLATDNGYLRLLGEVGILGLFSFALVFANMGKETLGVLFKKADRLEIAYTQGIIAAIPGIFLNLVFIDILDASKFAIMFWMLLGFAIASMRLTKKE